MATTLLRAELNQLLLEEGGTCDPAQLHRLDRRINRLSGIDRHKQLVLGYKLGVLGVLGGHYQLALDYLQPVLDERRPLRYDLIVYTRLLQLWCHHRLGHAEFVGYGISNVARYLGRIGYRSPYPGLVLQLLRGLQKGNVAAAVANYRARTRPLRENVFHLREFRYLDVERLL